MRRLAWLAALMLMVSCSFAAGRNGPNETLFQEKMTPVLESQCVMCHGQENPSSDLSVLSYEAVLRGGKRGPAIVPGDAEKSLLIHLVEGKEQPQMPLGGSLPESIVAELRTAIDAMDPLAEELPRDSYLAWLYEKPTPPPVPEVRNKDWVSSPIDAFVLAKLEERGLLPAPPADRRALLRRVYFDLIGLPPSPEEIQRFVDDLDPDAYETVIDRLLESKHYGERWGRHWLDLVRYADTDGYAIDAERPTAWRYRDYVIRAFNDDKPYDQFIREQVAGDELANTGVSETSRSELLIALGFYGMGPIEPEAFDKPQLRADVMAEVATTLGSAFLGQTIGCARCHDHKYDPIPQRDFSRIQAFLAATYFDEIEAPFLEVEHPIEMKRLRREYQDQAEWAQAEFRGVEKHMEREFRKLKNLKPDEALTKKLQDEFRRGLREEENSPFTAEERNLYRRAEDRYKKAYEAYLRRRPIAFSVSELVPPRVIEMPKTYILAGGQAAAAGSEVQPGFLEAMVGKLEDAEIPFGGDESSGRRLALANWIASPDNPLTARVMVNRIWQHHFGHGLVRTPSDFGKNGSRPSHPELLDWLATQFTEEKNWSIKQMHRLILTSKTYRQSTENPETQEYVQIDPDNQYLWHMNWIRLDAEILRDSILAVSGRLNSKMGGPGVFLDLPDDMTESFEFFRWYPSEEEEQNRRAVYMFQRRNMVPPMMEVFDVANMSESCDRRKETIVPPQAFTLLNSNFVNEAARHFAERVIDEAGPDTSEQIKRAFWRALGRAPTETEKENTMALYALAPPIEVLTDLGVVLLNTNEFLYLE